MSSVTLSNNPFLRPLERQYLSLLMQRVIVLPLLATS